MRKNARYAGKKGEALHYRAARRGLKTEGGTIFVELTPCIDCARAIIQSGIAQVVINSERDSDYSSDRYSREHPVALAMLAEAGVSVRFAPPTSSE